MAEVRKQRTVAVLALLVVFIYFYFHWQPQPPGFTVSHTPSTGLLLDFHGLPAANATLGFGAVVAVSRAESSRRESLLLAANITEIEITIPEQPVWTQDDINSVKAERGSLISPGSTLAWLGHLNLLRWFLASSLETILILEDDVDWDIHLRTQQIPRTAAATRHLLSTTAEQAAASVLTPEEAGTYWGPLNSWDILYLGHCSDIFKPSRWNFHVPRTAFHDPTMPLQEAMHPFTRDFMQALEIPESVRLVHQSIFPLCTFAFALTRSAAERLLNELANRERDGGTMAYDVRVLEACRDEGLKCWSTNPELFHHIEAPSEIAIVNGQNSLDGLVQENEGVAPNIVCGARSKSFFTREKATMEYLREVVGRQGKCLKDRVEENMKEYPGFGN